LSKNLELAEIEAIVSEIEREKEAGELSIVILILDNCCILSEAERKRSRLAATTAGQAAMSQRAPAGESSG